MMAIAIIAEIGLDMTLFPTAAHLVSWAGLCRSASQSGTRQGKGKQKKGNSYAHYLAGQAALGASRTNSFPDELYARIARRRGKAIAQAAVARSIVIIISLAPAVRSRGPLPRPRPGPLHPPHQPGQEDPQPHPAAPGPRRGGLACAAALRLRQAFPPRQHPPAPLPPA